MCVWVSDGANELKIRFWLSLIKMRRNDGKWNERDYFKGKKTYYLIDNLNWKWKGWQWNRWKMKPIFLENETYFFWKIKPIFLENGIFNKLWHCEEKPAILAGYPLQRKNLTCSIFQNFKIITIIRWNHWFFLTIVYCQYKENKV